jgi:hypothetical protein
VADLKEVSLESVCGGVLPALFQRELAKVLEDIDNPNTPAKAKRTISIEVTFHPTEMREAAGITAVCKSKLAGVAPIARMVHLTKRQGRLLALENNPNQEELFDAAPDGRPTLVPGGAGSAS